MAVLYITELTNQGTDRLGRQVPVPQMPPIAEQTVAIGASSVQSAALNPLTNLVRVHTDLGCSISFGLSPTATTTTLRMPKDTAEYFGVKENSGWKIAVITN